jgi:hypothetical protein
MRTIIPLKTLLKRRLTMAATISQFEKEEFKAGNRNYRIEVLQSILRDNNAFMQFHMKRLFTNKPQPNQKQPVLPDKNTTSLTVALDIGNLL